MVKNKGEFKGKGKHGSIKLQDNETIINLLYAILEELEKKQ